MYFAVFMKAFKGQVVRMLRHPCASRVVNELYTAASTKQRRTLTAEFYGREAMLFHEASTLSWYPHKPGIVVCNDYLPAEHRLPACNIGLEADLQERCWPGLLLRPSSYVHAA